MKRLVLLGHPVTHSLSPTMQRAAIEATGLGWDYQAIDVEPGELPAAVDQLRAGEWLGANLTLPHKQAVLPLIDELAASARHTSAVNTVVVEDGRLVGHNSDLAGFMHDLGLHCQIQDIGASAILGAGGAARAVAFGLAQQGVDLHLIARSERRAEALADGVRRRHPVDVVVLPWEGASFATVGDKCGLIVNATPVGMRPNDAETAWPANVPLPAGSFVYDLVYSPRDTRLTQDARLAGLDSVSGAGMLVEQGALSFELWTGLGAPRREMRAALDHELERSRVQLRMGASS